jgi:hypothetical protein
MKLLPISSCGVEAGAIQDVWESLKAFLLAIGDDVQMKELEHYTTFRQSLRVCLVHSAVA